MRHRVYGKHLQRDKNQRTALFRSLVRELVLHESIQTTSAKAKAIKGLVDKLITKSKENTNASKLVVESFVNQPAISKKLMEEIAPRFKDRTSGFTNIVRLGSRAGDGAVMVQMSLIQADKVSEKTAKELKKIDAEKAAKATVTETVESAVEVKEEKAKKTRKAAK